MKIKTLIHEPPTLLDYFTQKDINEKSQRLLDVCGCHILNLKNAPTKMNGTLSCTNNKFIQSLEGCPSYIGGSFLIEHCPNLRSLDFLPEHIGRAFSFSGTPIQSLQNLHKKLKYVQRIYINTNPVPSHLLGVLLIDSVKSIHLSKWKANIQKVEILQEILNKHLQNPNKHLRIIECAEELIENGFEEYAQL